MTDGPAMSVVLVTDTFETIRRTIEHLARRRSATGSRSVIATRSTSPDWGSTNRHRRFDSVNVVETATLDILIIATRCRDAGGTCADRPRRRDAQLPGPDALEMLLERHREPWAVVGMAVKQRESGDSAIGWSNVLMDYGSQLAGTPGGEVARIASHNGSYKRSALLALGDRARAPRRVPVTC